MKQTKVIAIANHKGGVGKTTTVVSLGTILGKTHKVLLVDLDPQQSLTLSILKEDPGDNNIYPALIGEIDTLPIMKAGNVDLVPSSLNLSLAEFQMVSMMARERRLTNLLESIKDNYDYILLDCPPSLGVLTLNALTAADSVIVPLIPELLPLKGLSTIEDLIARIKKSLNPKLNISGILITRSEQTKIHKTLEGKLRQQLGNMVFTSKIRKNISIAEAPTNKKSIVEYDPLSNGAADYTAFAKEFEKRFEINSIN